MITYKTGVADIDWFQLFQTYDRVGLVAGLAKSREYEKIKDAFTQSYKVFMVSVRTRRNVMRHCS